MTPFRSRFGGGLRGVASAAAVLYLATSHGCLSGCKAFDMPSATALAQVDTKLSAVLDATAELTSNVGSVETKVGRIDTRIGAIKVGGGGDSVTAWIYGLGGVGLCFVAMLIPSPLRLFGGNKPKEKHA